jgi:hypothetical protein
MQARPSPSKEILDRRVAQQSFLGLQHRRFPRPLVRKAIKSPQCCDARNLISTNPRYFGKSKTTVVNTNFPGRKVPRCSYKNFRDHQKQSKLKPSSEFIEQSNCERRCAFRGRVGDLFSHFCIGAWKRLCPHIMSASCWNCHKTRSE